MFTWPGQGLSYITGTSFLIKQSSDRNLNMYFVRSSLCYRRIMRFVALFFRVFSSLSNLHPFFVPSYLFYIVFVILSQKWQYFSYYKFNVKWLQYLLDVFQHAFFLFAELISFLCKIVFFHFKFMLNNKMTVWVRVHMGLLHALYYSQTGCSRASNIAILSHN